MLKLHKGSYTRQNWKRNENLG